MDGTGRFFCNLLEGFRSRVLLDGESGSFSLIVAHSAKDLGGSDEATPCFISRFTSSRCGDVFILAIGALLLTVESFEGKYIFIKGESTGFLKFQIILHKKN